MMKRARVHSVKLPPRSKFLCMHLNYVADIVSRQHFQNKQNNNSNPDSSKLM